MIAIIFTSIAFLILGIIAVTMTIKFDKNEELRHATNADIKKFKDTEYALREAEFAYNESLSKLKVIEAQREELKLSIDKRMDDMGFINRLLTVNPLRR